MPEFHFDERTHTYRVDGQRYPSVSEIIAPLVDLDGIPTKVLAAKAELGKEVHSHCHLHDVGLLDCSFVHAAHAGYVVAWTKFCEKHQPQWEVIEEPLYSAERRFAGTPDRFGSILVEGGRCRATVDIKNVYQLRPATGVQLSGYSLLLNAPASRRFAVQLKPDGDFVLKEYGDEIVTFLSLLNVYNWRRKHG